MSSQLPKVIVFVSSNRDVRNADRVIPFVRQSLARSFDVTIFDPKELQLPLLIKPLQGYQSEAPEQLRKLNEQIVSADAFVFLTAEYNRGVPPALTNMLDHFPVASYNWKAGMTISYSLSPLGGNIAPFVLLPMIRALGVHLVPTSLGIAHVEKALSADGLVQAGHEFIQQTLDKGVDQLLWLSDALKTARQRNAPPK